MDLEIPTETKEPNFDINLDDFPGIEQEQSDPPPPPNGGSQPGQNLDLNTPVEDTEEKPLYNENEFSSLMADVFDSAQGNFSIAMIVKKRRKRYFGSNEKFHKAEEYFFMGETERESLDKEKVAEAKNLAERYRKYTLSLKDLTDKYMMSDSERRLFKRPLTRIAKQNGIDMHPGVSVGIIALKILSDRFIDIAMLE